MANSKRVQIFAGPNGSGKSTLFDAFVKEYKEKTGYFVNADLIEKTLGSTSLIDLAAFGVSASQEDLEEFKKLPASKSLIDKAKIDGHTIDLHIKENCIVDNSVNVHSYEGPLLLPLFVIC